MALNIDEKSWTEVRDLFRSWREENVRRSLDVVDLWETVLAKKINALGDESRQGQFLNTANYVAAEGAN
uniref:Uncharacterized protein n=1 Tax=Timema bartmani TaxID=61472 RepID=A0A7R9HWH9_9NEOP|nr:unnamed protein product [Timema bartmani]